MGDLRKLWAKKIYYFNEFGTYTAFFSDKSIIIGKPKKESKRKHKEEIESIKWEYFKIQFQSINNESTRLGENLKPYTRNFQNPKNQKETIKAKAYENLIYKNIYDKIDLVFEVPSAGGLKYSFIVHPGGNYAEIEMKYVNIEPYRVDNGNLKLVNDDNEFFDHAPNIFCF